MTPAFLITADGLDVTAKLQSRLISLSLSDEEGIKADRLVIEVDDRDGRVALPPHQVELVVSLGYLEQGLTQMGTFLVDETSGSGPPQTMTIGATAADMSGSIRSPKTRAWEDQTLSDITETIASEAGLRAQVGESLADTLYPFVAQQAESDMNLLTRLAVDLDATAKAADGVLVVMKRGEGRAADGTELTPQPIAKADMTQWRWELGDRKRYTRAIAEWAELGAGAINKVELGEGDPVYRVRHVLDNEAAAERAARAALDGAGRGTGSIEIDCAQFQPALFAGGLIELVDLRPELNGIWSIKSVQHRLQSTLLTSLTAELQEPRD
ncbi:MAG: contractile injection system protein, VgrG/Pvc8 family [Pseudomonadota bacterium]